MMLDTPFGPVHFTTEEQLAYPKRFFLWVQQNWHIYREFVDRSFEYKRSGREYFFAKKIVEDIRADSAKHSIGDKMFKINNNYTSGLSRLAQRQFEELRGFFKCRDRSGNDVKQECAA